MCDAAESYYEDKSREKRPRDDSRGRDQGSGSSRGDNLHGRYSSSRDFGRDDSHPSGRFRGRGDGRGGGRGGRGNHMGELDAIRALLRNSKMNDSTLLRVISPPQSELDRQKLITDVNMPRHEPWRETGVEVGVSIGDNGGGIRVNAFKIPLDKLPQTINQYRVEINRVENDGAVNETDIAENKKSENMSISVLTQLMADLGINPFKGLAYDGSHLLCSSFPLSPEDDDQHQSKRGTSAYSETVSNSALTSSLVPSDTSSEETKSSIGRAVRTHLVVLPSGMKYRVKLQVLASCIKPSALDNHDRWTSYLRLLDITLISSVRWKSITEAPVWFVEKTNIFQVAGSKITISAYNRDVHYLEAMKGYSSSIKICKAGLTLLTDVAVSVFFKGGPLIEVLATIGNYQVPELIQEAKERRLSSKFANAHLSKMKNLKVLILHLNHIRKLQGFGPPADSREEVFNYNGSNVTVAEYFEIICRDNPTPLLEKYLPDKRLKYPFMPTINIGSKNRKVLIPWELVVINPGQSRPVDASIQAQVIRISAIAPEERIRFITDATHGLANVIRSDSICSAYGLSTVSQDPLKVRAKLLPPARLLYGKGVIVEPGLEGTWVMHNRETFFDPCQGLYQPEVYYGIVIVANRENDFRRDVVEKFRLQLENESLNVGIVLRLGGPLIYTEIDSNEIAKNFDRIKLGKCSFALVITVQEAYKEVKYASAATLLPTQVVKYQRVEKTPKGIYLNLLLKINSKIGGVNHVLASRDHEAPRPNSPHTPIPSSLSWLFENPKERTMVCGLDFSEKSFMAMTGSMDVHCVKYGAFICSLVRENDFTYEIEEATYALLYEYNRRNGVFPKNILVYRDGMSDSEFDLVIQEATAIRRAAARHPACPDVRVSIIVCQKRHRIRFFYESIGQSTQSHHNPCPGVCVDVTDPSSICQDRYMEFYLNSHSPLQGTCKPCRYILLYDEIGLKLGETELMTYWICYLYARCNRSVSYPAPTYYAHWASKRAKFLGAAGATAEEIVDFSRNWLHDDSTVSMFFV